MPQKRVGSHASDKSDKASHAGASKATPKPAPKHPDEKPANNNHPNYTSANAVDVRQRGSSKSIGVEKKALVENKTDNNRGLSGRPPAVVSLGGPMSNALHRRGPAPAIIGGPTISTVQSTAAINGTGIRNRPQ